MVDIFSGKRDIIRAMQEIEINRTGVLE